MLSELLEGIDYLFDFLTFIIPIGNEWQKQI